MRDEAGCPHEEGEEGKEEEEPGHDSDEESNTLDDLRVADQVEITVH